MWWVKMWVAGAGIGPGFSHGVVGNWEAMQWLEVMVVMVAAAEGGPWVLCAQAEGGEVTWQATRLVGGGSGSVCIHEVGINIMSPIKQCLHSVHGWVCLHVCLPHGFHLICPSLHWTLWGHPHHLWCGIGLLSGDLLGVLGDPP